MANFSPTTTTQEGQALRRMGLNPPIGGKERFRSRVPILATRSKLNLHNDSLVRAKRNALVHILPGTIKVCGQQHSPRGVRDSRLFMTQIEGNCKSIIPLASFVPQNIPLN